MRSSCRGRCTMESNCVSFNIGPPINDQVMCQLSDSDHTRHPEDLKPREGFTYRGTEVRNCNSMATLVWFFCLKVVETVCFQWNYCNVSTTCFCSYQNPCSSNPCSHNASCLNGFTYSKYRCVCQTGYRGENCEIGKTNNNRNNFYFNVHFKITAFLDTFSSKMQIHHPIRRGVKRGARTGCRSRGGGGGGGGSALSEFLVNEFFYRL